MPATITITGSLAVGESAAATIKDYLGRRQAKTPVHVTLVNERLLRIGDGDFRSILACTGVNGVSRYLVSGSRLSAAEQQRRYALTHGKDLLRQLTAVLRPLEQSDELAEALQSLFDWLAEREQEQTLPPPNTGVHINVHKW